MPYADPEKNKACIKAYAARMKVEDPIGYAARENAKVKAYQRRNVEKLKAANKRYKLKNPANQLVWAARYRARKFGLSCDLEAGDLTIPEFCPVLGIRLAKAIPGSNKWSPTSPSVDRVNPKLGYTKGNVRVISWRANNLKSDGTAQEFELIAAYLRGRL